MITRRALLALGAVSLTTPLAGCSMESIDALRPAAKQPEVDTDALLLARVRAAVERARDLAAGTPFAALHTAQLAALDGPPSSPTAAPPTPPVTPPAAPATADQVHASETALQQRLLAACRRADSGQLAMVLASMAAGIGQVLA